MSGPVEALPRSRGPSLDELRGARVAPRRIFGPRARASALPVPVPDLPLLLLSLFLSLSLALAACSPSRRARPARDDAAPAALDAAPAPAPVDAAPDARPAPDGWTDVALAIPDAVLDLRYATDRNLTGHRLYPTARCLLRAPVASQLAEAARRLRAGGHRLVLWDCYRPASLQRELWRRVPDRRFVAEPVFDERGLPLAGSRHSRGAAVDVSLADADGAPRAMPTDHDDFGPGASGARATGDAARWLADLRAAMTAAGFAPLASEWWHFDVAGAYPLADDPLE